MEAAIKTPGAIEKYAVVKVPHDKDQYRKATNH
jgi:hypothetical protein